MKTSNNTRLVYIGNYPPRQCGIGTFTENLVKSVAYAAAQSEYPLHAEVVAMNNGTSYQYPDIVSRVIQEETVEHYLETAAHINQTADVCIIQHEYGIFGGDHGQHLLKLVNQLKIPFLVTLHTVLQQPSRAQRQIVRLLAEKTYQLVVMSQKAKNFLIDSYGISAEKIAIIEHGVPNAPRGDRMTLRKEFGFDGKKIVLTFGLLGPGKGIETMIRALPELLEQHPDVEYWVLGKTHPNIVKHEGERYRESLMNMAEELGVGDHLVMKNEFVDETMLFNYLRATDIYVTPYPHEAQITSGTLSYAVGAGTPVVSTPYWHAQELLADGRGRYFDFKNSDQLAGVLRDLFNREDELQDIAAKAAQYGDTLRWNTKGQEYLDVVRRSIIEPIDAAAKPGPAPGRQQLPAVNFDHLRALTDGTGVIQHAKYAIPNFKEGYCLDDNARALLLGATAHQQGYRQLDGVIQSALSYIYYAQTEDGWFRNFMSYDRKFLDQVGSEDAFGRAMWALGYALAYPPGDIHQPLIREIYYKAFDKIDTLISLRSMAYAALGICYSLEQFPADQRLLEQLERLRNRIADEFRHGKTDGWDWYESVVAYGNGFLPLSLIRSLEFLEDEEVRQIAFSSLKFLEELTLAGEHLRPIGCNPFFRRGEKVCHFDQQPIDAMAMVLLYTYAYRLTGEAEFQQKARLSFEWFLGKNDLGLPLYNETNGGCYDGLMPDGVNLNQGAESTIAFLISRLQVNDLYNDERPLTRQDVNRLERSKETHNRIQDVVRARPFRRQRISYWKD